MEERRKRKARKRGSRSGDEAKLRDRYDAAKKIKSRGAAWNEPLDLFAATGDPLAEQDKELAESVYGLAQAARRNVALRRIRAESFGDSLSSLTDMAIWFQENRGCSALRSAGEAAALAAERGTWIGVRARVSLDRAVELIRKSVGRARALGRFRYQPHGWTGRQLYVVPATGGLVPMPAPLPPRTRLPGEGAWVRDDHYWRRCVRDGAVRVLSTSDKENPTIAADMTAS